MIRPLTCVCMLLAAGSGLYLYQTKHRSQMLDREIQRTIKQTEVVRDRTGVLRGEWALLSEPDRLTELARQHLTLRSLVPTQFVALAELSGRLPAVLAPGSMMAVPEETVVDLPPLAMAKLQQPLLMATPIAAAPIAAAPVAAARAMQAPAQPVQVAALPPPPAATKPKPAAPRVADTVPPAARVTAPVVTVAAAPIGGSAAGNVIGESVARVARGLPPLTYRSDTMQVAAAPIASAPMASAPMASAPMASAPVYSAPMASALGGAARTALPAPVPYNAAR